MKLSTHGLTFTSLAEVAGMRCGCNEEPSFELRGVQPNSILELSCNAQQENVALSIARSTCGKTEIQSDVNQLSEMQ